MTSSSHHEYDYEQEYDDQSAAGSHSEPASDVPAEAASEVSPEAAAEAGSSPAEYEYESSEEEEEANVIDETPFMAPISGKKLYAKHRVLLFCSRGQSSRSMQLLHDLAVLVPHHKDEPKLDPRDGLAVLSGVAESRNCDVIAYLETKARMDTFLWITGVPYGPSVRFFIDDLNSSADLRLLGNAVRGSRPVLSFNDGFESNSLTRLFKESLKQLFAAPNLHPKTKPFVDRTMTFTFVDGKIYVRNYQIVDTEVGKNQNETSLVEIGPRFTMIPEKVLSGCFRGDVIWANQTNDIETRYAYLQAQKGKPSRFQQRVADAQRGSGRPGDTERYAPDDVFGELDERRDYRGFKAGVPEDVQLDAFAEETEFKL